MSLAMNRADLERKIVDWMRDGGYPIPVGSEEIVVEDVAPEATKEQVVAVLNLLHIAGVVEPVGDMFDAAWTLRRR